MSFDFPAQPQRRVRPRGGGCGRLIFMLVIMFAVYYMFSAGRPRQQKPQRGVGGPGDILAPDPQNGDREGLKREIFGDGTVPTAEDPHPAGRPMPSTNRKDVKREIFGDGTIPSANDQQPSGREMPSTGRSGTNGDWQMEDVEPEKRSNNDFRNDSRLPAPSTSNSGSTSDWSIEDVD